MPLEHPALVDLLKKAYSAEKAAAFAYIGHARSLRTEEEKGAVRQIEQDEWEHRANVLKLLELYEIPVSRVYETRFHLIGKTISAACYVIGWFMPYYFAGRLESGNVCEYFVMIHYFHELGITEHDEILYEMAIKEKEHEDYFLGRIRDHRYLSYFQKIFNWGEGSSFNDVDMQELLPVERSGAYCEHHPHHGSATRKE